MSGRGEGLERRCADQLHDRQGRGDQLVGSGAETVGFSGGIGHPPRRTDLENSLVYMRARYYDPSLGRFISEDPGRNGSNWYVYCQNNPVNAVDATGQFAVPVILAALIVGALVGLGLYMGYSSCRGVPMTLQGAFEWTAGGAVGAVIALALASLAGVAAIGGTISGTALAIQALLATPGGILGGFTMGGWGFCPASGGVSGAGSAIGEHMIAIGVALDMAEADI